MYEAISRIRLNIYGDNTAFDISCGCLTPKEDAYMREAIAAAEQKVEPVSYSEEKEIEK